MKKIKFYIEQNIKRIFLFISLLSIILGLGIIYSLVEILPTSNDECLWIPKRIAPDTLEVYFDFVKFEGVTWNAGVRDGDKLVAINGVPVKNTYVATYVLDQVAAGDSAVYTIERNGQTIETKVEVKKLINITRLAFALFAFIWMIIATMVIAANPYGRTQRLFFFIGVMLIFTNTSLPFNTIDFMKLDYIPDSILNFLILLRLFGFAFLPFVVVHFFWVFPLERKIITRKWTIKILYAIPTVLFLLSLLFEAWDAKSFTYEKMLLLSVMSVLGIAGNITGIIALFKSYSKLKTKRERNSIFIILVGYMLGLGALAYFLIVANTLPRAAIFNSPEYFLPIVLITFVPISFGYSVFKYSLMDVSDVFKNTIIYGTATLSIAGIYFFLIYFLGQSISQAISSDYQGIFAAIIFIGFALVFQSTKDKFQDLLTRRFYPEQFAFQEVLVKFSRDVSTIVKLDPILDSIKKIFIDSLRLQKAGLVLRSGNSNECRSYFSVGYNGEKLSFKNYQMRILRFVDKKKKLKQLPAIDQNDFETVFPAISGELKKQEIFTIIPLLIKSKVIGLVLFGLKHSGSQFAGKDLELLSAVANQIAVSIENARLYESESEKVKMDRDLENAKKIQRSLLPKEIPIFPQMEISGTMIPALQVGGDYYDIIKIADDKFFVIVGDVSGKGLAASYYMTKLQTMMRLFAEKAADPREVLIEVNKKIFSEIERNWFITVSVGLFDLTKRTLLFCRAGHTPLIQISGNRAETFVPKGLGVGLERGKVFDSTLEQIEIPLDSDNLFAFYSDGITEDISPNGELFGVEPLKTILKENKEKNVEIINQKILDALYDFRQSDQQSDDITLVLVKYLGQ
ncbi:MAG: SpoIIE family protein phosphatase [Chlorobi bacterium]|nr:SpoIIE family protein phosphatase [Chlorobiota bacterium]